MTADEVRRYVLDVHAPAARAESEREDGDPRWWLGTCDSACSVIEEDLGARLAPFAVVWFGSFAGSGHCWLQAPDGTIVDPTAEQFGLEPCAIIAPDDPRQVLYHALS